MWGCEPAAAALNSVLWVSQASLDNGKYEVFRLISCPVSGGIDWQLNGPLGTISSYKFNKRAEAVKKCRDIGKKDMKLNNSMPKMQGKLQESR